MKSMYEAGLRLLTQLSPWAATDMLPNRARPRNTNCSMDHLSPRLLSAILETDGQSDVNARDAQKIRWPEAYSAFGNHVSVGRNVLFSGGEAPIARRFEVSDVSPEFGRLFDNCGPGSRVLELRLGGLEMCWHSDLLNASERQVPILGRIQLLLPGERFAELEHLVIPDAIHGETFLLRGWFNLLSGSLPDDVPWRDVLSRRMRRGQPIKIGPWGDLHSASSMNSASSR